MNVLRLSLPTLLCGALAAQTFDSGSDGSDGALVYPADLGVVNFDPTSFSPALDPDGDNVFHFTNLSIGLNTTLRLRADLLGGEGKPVYFLSQGDVIVTGVIDANGERGHAHNGTPIPSVPGAGGWGGGRGYPGPGSGLLPQPGNGPGGGGVLQRNSAGGAGHVGLGLGATTLRGARYGNEYVQPLLGGSGGGGGDRTNGFDLGGPGGGAGGGALLIASSSRIEVEGSITANGGNTGQGVTGATAAGGGSGGAIRLMAPVLAGSGLISAAGSSGSTRGSTGRIRLETFKFEGSATYNPGASIASPGLVFPPATAPLVTVTAVNGVPVVADPKGGFAMPDVTINSAIAVTVDLAASNIPLGTTLSLKIQPQTGSVVTASSTPLAGTFASSTATATVTFASGFTRFFVEADW